MGKVFVDSGKALDILQSTIIPQLPGKHNCVAFMDVANGI